LVRTGVRSGIDEEIGSSREENSAGHIRTTQPRRGQSLRSFRVVGRREYNNVIGNQRKAKTINFFFKERVIMLLDNIEIVERQEVKLVGYSLEASLNDIIQSKIVAKLREELSDKSNLIKSRLDEGIYLVQIYPHCEWTPDVVYRHIIAIEVSTFEDIPEGMITHSIPSGRYIKFSHEGPESEIGNTYDLINEWLEKNDFGGPRTFDTEYWKDIKTLEEHNNVINIYIPIK
jgi:predicted transcriptional regulator YdeE